MKPSLSKDIQCHGWPYSFNDFICLQITTSDIRPHIKWTVSLVITDGHLILMVWHTHFITPEGNSKRFGFNEVSVHPMCFFCCCRSQENPDRKYKLLKHEVHDHKISEMVLDISVASTRWRDQGLVEHKIALKLIYANWSKLLISVEKMLD